MSAKQPLWRRFLPIAGAIVLLVVLFGWVLPQFIDYDAVFRSIGSTDGREWLILIVLALVRFIPEGGLYVTAQPGLNMRQGTELFLVSESLSNVPHGDLDFVSRYQMARSWGFTASSSTSVTIVSWIFTTTGKLVLPIAASGLFALYRIREDDLDALVIFALGVFVVGGGR